MVRCKTKITRFTGKCFLTSSTSFTSEALGSSNEIATIFQSSSPSSIIAKAASGLTLRIWPVFACLSPISTTSTENMPLKELHSVCFAWNRLLSHIKTKAIPKYLDHYLLMLLQLQSLQTTGLPKSEEAVRSSNLCCSWSKNDETETIRAI